MRRWRPRPREKKSERKIPFRWGPGSVKIDINGPASPDHAYDIRTLVSARPRIGCLRSGRYGKKAHGLEESLERETSSFSSVADATQIGVHEGILASSAAEKLSL